MDMYIQINPNSYATASHLAVNGNVTLSAAVYQLVHKRAEGIEIGRLKSPLKSTDLSDLGNSLNYVETKGTTS